MQVRIVRVIDDEIVIAKIEVGRESELPSFSDGWRFDFKKNTKVERLKTYILVCEETSGIVEGCLSFKMRGKTEPYMAYVEVAHHNQGENKKFDRVAGCLIAYACRLSFIHGEGDYKGWLAFDVLEIKKEDEIKLMATYSIKYGALKFGKTTMVIPPETGEKLIEAFLK
ncbi:hypothetical protein DN068_18710 [Taibaiella soli]|uniref:GNAT family N-acetyltransferase n=2 Tax=Taibaiella soli TaxID=1649169 RepID=A0A2W2AUH3_9BACT|nr:hypothetical protein DN068_18710 [Taibaiella soli]